MSFARFAVTVCCLALTGCTHALVRPAASPARQASDALLVLPGVGYDRAGEAAFRALAPSTAADGLDLYLPRYVDRGGLEASRERLEDFVRVHRLDRYERVHIFAFIAGAWTVNPLIERNLLPNLSTILFDRSPYQERAPRVAVEQLRFLTWVRYGAAVSDLARTSYVPLMAPRARVGIVVETAPTRFIRRHAAAAAKAGPYDFGCGAFGQPYDDCIYVALSHDELYCRFADVWPEVRAFIRTGRFTPAANRRLPS